MKKPKVDDGRPAVFLDRDGVLNLDSGYVYQIKDLVILPGVKSGLATLKNHGFHLIVVTNQSGVARGYFGMDDVERFHEAMQKELGSLIDAFYVCPHFPGGTVRTFATPCKCRKPETKLIDDAMEDFRISSGDSFLIGDKESDIQCGKKAGLRTIQIAGSYGVVDQANAVVSDFASAVRWVLQHAKKM